MPGSYKSNTQYSASTVRRKQNRTDLQVQLLSRGAVPRQPFQGAFARWFDVIAVSAVGARRQNGGPKVDAPPHLRLRHDGGPALACESDGCHPAA